MYRELASGSRLAQNPAGSLVSRPPIGWGREAGVSRAHWDERYGTAELIWKADPNRFLVEELEGLAPGRALDIACGEGRNAIWLASMGWEVTGVDFSAVGLAKARSGMRQSVGCGPPGSRRTSSGGSRLRPPSMRSW